MLLGLFLFFKNVETTLGSGLCRYVEVDFERGSENVGIDYNEFILLLWADE